MVDLQFDAMDLATKLDALDDELRHELRFGVIGLDAQGRVTFYSRTEARKSGRGQAPVVGDLFFRNVAPCMNTHEVRGRIEAERARGTLDIELGHTGDFDDPARFVRIRVMSASGGGLWLALDRPSLAEADATAG